MLKKKSKKEMQLEFVHHLFFPQNRYFHGIVPH